MDGRHRVKRSIAAASRRAALLIAAALIAAGAALGACGGSDEPQRQDYNKLIAPERCGGSGGGPC